MCRYMQWKYPIPDLCVWKRLVSPTNHIDLLGNNLCRAFSRLSQSEVFLRRCACLGPVTHDCLRCARLSHQTMIMIRTWNAIGVPLSETRRHRMWRHVQRYVWFVLFIARKRLIGLVTEMSNLAILHAIISVQTPSVYSTCISLCCGYAINVIDIQ